MAEDGQDKRHAPTERRLRQAAEKGDVRRSGDLPKAAALVLAVTLALHAAGLVAGRIGALFAACLGGAGTAGVGRGGAWLAGAAGA